MLSSSTQSSDFIKKKENMEEYKELFAALFKIPDTNLHIRVINAINNKSNDKIKLKTTVSVGIQVNMTTVEENNSIDKSKFKNDNGNSDSDRRDDNLYINSKDNKSKIISVGKKVKLGRTKKCKVPYAIKIDPNLSNNNKLEKNNKRKLDKSNIIINKDAKKMLKNNENLSQDLIKIIDDFEVNDNDLDIDNISLDSFSSFKISQRLILETMKNDWNNCLTYHDELLDIHKAVIDEDLVFLKRQCLTLKAKIGNIDVETSEGQHTALDIALTCNCKIDIIELLLLYNINIYNQNMDGNNALHLAVLHSNDINILKLLLKNVPLEKLNIINDDGFSIIHLAVKQKNIFILKCIIEHIDKLLNMENLTAHITDANNLFDYLRKAIHSNKYALVDYKNVCRMNLLDQKDRKTGKTPLFHAVYDENEIITLYLLINGCDPRIESLAGNDSILFAAENINNKLITLAITKRMQYYSNLIKKNNIESKPIKRKIINKIN